MSTFCKLLRSDKDGRWYLVNPKNLFEALRVGWLLWRQPDRIAALIAPNQRFTVDTTALRLRPDQTSH